LDVKINYMEMSKTALNKAPLTFIGDKQAHGVFRTSSCK